MLLKAETNLFGWGKQLRSSRNDDKLGRGGGEAGGWHSSCELLGRNR